MIAYDKWCLYIDAEQNKYNLTTILVHGVLSVAKSNGNGSPYFYHVNLSVFVGIYSLLLKWNKSQASSDWSIKQSTIIFLINSGKD